MIMSDQIAISERFTSKGRYGVTETLSKEARFRGTRRYAKVLRTVWKPRENFRPRIPFAPAPR